MNKPEVSSIEAILNKISDPFERGEVYRILYGKSQHDALELSDETRQFAETNNFDISAYVFAAEPEQTRPPKVVRIAAIQNSIACSTSLPVVAQRSAIHAKVGDLIDAAGREGVNILCLQETWTMPIGFCTRERLPWCEFAESAENGPTTKFLSEYCCKYGMVIVSPILERDELHGDTIWNTAVVIDDRGNVIGKYRKNHIPKVGDESTFFTDGNTGHPVFKTRYGNVGVCICYDRHHVQNWMMLGINGAEVVFNPSAVMGPEIEPLWIIEARNAAIANSYFTCAINRVGTEVFPNEFTCGDKQPARKDLGHFFGSSYISAPDGSRTPGLSRVQDGLLIAEIDLNLCRQVKDKWGFRMTQRLNLYADSLARASMDDYEPQIVSKNY